MVKNVLTAVFVYLVVANFASVNGLLDRFEDFLEETNFNDEEIFIIRYFENMARRSLGSSCYRRNHLSLPKVMDTVASAEAYLVDRTIDIYKSVLSNRNIGMIMMNQCNRMLGVEISLRYSVLIMSVCLTEEQNRYAERILKTILDMISFFCDNEAKNLRSFFLKEDDCILTNLKSSIVNCNYYLVDVELQKRHNTYMIQLLNEEEIEENEDMIITICAIIDQLNECMIDALDVCEYSKSANEMIDLFIRHVRLSMWC